MAAKNSRDFRRAERMELQNITCLKEREQIHSEPFDDEQENECLAAIYIDNSEPEKAEEVSRQLLGAKKHSSANGLGKKSRRKSPVGIDPQGSRQKAEHYRSLAMSLLMKSKDSTQMDVSLLVNSEKCAKRAVKLLRETL